ncbi:MAG: SDR family oxidoreductase [Treponemataceae bacterium]|nr:SDR family oxidoreductase [Treponemataceae bacterium]
MNSFDNFFCKKNALVVGGSGGIGKSISLMLAKSGANVTVHGGHASEKFDLLLREMNSISNSEFQTQKHRQIILDFAKIDLEKFDEKNSAHFVDENSAKKIQKNCGKKIREEKISEKNSCEISSLENLKSALKKSEILCICYGPFLQKKIAQTSAQEWLWMAKLNLALPGILAGYAARFMKRRGFGRILFFGGTRTNQINGFKTNAAYAAAKTGIASLAKSFALEFAECGISTAAIFPGFVQTEYVSEKARAEYEKLLCGKKMIRADEIARAALFLLSDSNLNGTLLEMDGGWRP